MSEPQLRLPSQEEVEELKRQALLQADWPMDQLLELSQLFKDSRYQLLAKCLQAMELQLDRQVWDPRNDFQQYTFLRGQHNMLKRLLKLPEEMALIRAAKAQQLKEKEDGNTSSS